jgi:hypothetical protein
MNNIKLPRFTWSYVQLQNGKILSPVCPNHPGAYVSLKVSGNDRVVICTAGGYEIVGMCSELEFETEKREAATILAKLPAEA